MPEVSQPALGAHVRVAVGCVGDRAVDDAGDTGVAEHGYAFAGVEDLGLEAFQVFAPEHVREHLRDAVAPHRGGLPLVRPEDEAVAFLAQVVAGVGVAQQRQGELAGREFGDLLGDVVLVRHLGDRVMTAEERHHLAGAVAGGVDDVLAVHDVLGAVGCARGDRPMAVRMLHEADDALETAHARAQRAGGAGEGLRDLRRVDVAVERIPQRGDQVVRLHQRVDLDQLVGGEHVVAHALRVGHAGDVAELGEALVAVGQAHRTGDVVADREVRVLRQLAVEGRGVRLHLHHAPAGAVRGHVAGRVPGAAGGELVALQQQGIGAAHLCQVVQRAAAGDATSDDDDSRLLVHVRTPSPDDSSSRRHPGGRRLGVVV